MKRLLEFVTYLFYRYYNKGSTKIIAYESALIAVSALIFLNVFAILVFFNVDASWVDRIERNYGKLIKLIFGILIGLFPYLILFFTLKKETIIKRKVDLKVIKKWNLVLVLYIVFSVILLSLSIKMSPE